MEEEEHLTDAIFYVRFFFIKPTTQLPLAVKGSTPLKFLLETFY